MKYLIISILIFSFSALDGQMGISARYNSSSFSAWNEFISSGNQSANGLFETGMEAGVNYWFRLKEQRIEFLPELYYGSSSTDNISISPRFSKAEMTYYGLRLNVQIYPLDFFNDCNCPTFSKQGTFFSKGFYWLLAPSAVYVQKTAHYNVDQLPAVLDSGSDPVVSLGLGAGLDIGFADIFTLSPYAMYEFQAGHDFDELNEIYGTDGEDRVDLGTHASRFSVGLRLMFRPDYVRRNR